MIKAIAIQLLVHLVKKYPNDKDLGAAFRKLMKDDYGVS